MMIVEIFWDISAGGKFEWPFTIAVKIVGFVEDKVMDIDYRGNEHNHSRTLQCGTVRGNI